MVRPVSPIHYPSAGLDSSQWWQNMIVLVIDYMTQPGPQGRFNPPALKAAIEGMMPLLEKSGCSYQQLQSDFNQYLSQPNQSIFNAIVNDLKKLQNFSPNLSQRDLYSSLNEMLSVMHDAVAQKVSMWPLGGVFNYVTVMSNNKLPANFNDYYNPWYQNVNDYQNGYNSLNGPTPDQIANLEGGIGNLQWHCFPPS
jgi:hypothetical protein